jgi:DNA-binding transcriptional LysR family regulator
MVAETYGFTPAPEGLRLTQPTISDQVQGLAG